MATSPVVPTPKTNPIGLEILDYRGGKSTLCAGCGHNAISERILEAYYEMGIQPETVMKMSGIGCSSKSPAYFMSRSFSFNSVHGRMPSVATGAILANKTMRSIGISGDGDTASIGVGQFTFSAATFRSSTSSRTTAYTGSPRASFPRPPISAPS